MLENRIVELEVKAAYQDDLLQTLNQIVSRQQQQINRLEATCGLLHERIKSLSSELGHSEPSAQEIPPHY